MANRLPHNTVLIATLYVFVVSPLHAGEISRLLDGMTFVGNNGEKGRELDPDEHEEIIFENGRFRSISCDPYNFGDSEYSTSVMGNAIHFDLAIFLWTPGSLSGLPILEIPG